MLDKELLGLLGSSKRYVYRILILMVFGLFASLCITGSICYAIDLAVGHFAQTAAGSLLIVPVFCSVIGILLRYKITCRVGDDKDLLGRQVKIKLREKVYQKILCLGVRSAEDMSMAGLTQVAMEGIEQLDLYYSTYIPQFFYAMTAPFILFLVTVRIDWPTAVILLASVPLIPISIIAVSKYANRIFAKYWGQYTSMGDGFLDRVQGLRELKIFQADEAQHQKMNENAEAFRKITMKVLVMQLASTTIMDLVAYGGAGLGIAAAITGIFDRGLAPTKALFLILVAVEFFLPLRAFGSAFHIAMNGGSAGKKILALLEQPEPLWGTENLESEHMEAELKNITFSYDGKREILKNITMKFPKQGMTAIVGESGCGKSTIVGLFSGGIRPDSGMVTVDGKALETFSRKSWYSHLAVVGCGTYLFNDTVRDNFWMANPKASEEEIYEALEKVNLADFIRNSGGLDLMLSEDAGNISGGQKQRLTLAINLLTDKDIYIFDEATSSIDSESEAIIMRNIQELSKKKAVIVISHRLENVVSSDQIFYMEDGMVKESGTHHSLMEENGGYAGLYRAQKILEKGCLEV